VHKGPKQASSFVEKPAGKPMTCISQAILAEIENQTIHYDIYQKMAQPSNEGKREALLKKMQKKEGSYANINKSSMNVNEPEK